MSELFKIVLTACLTIAGGIIVFVAGRIIETWFIVPVHALKSAKGGVAWALFYYADTYGSGGIREREVLLAASDALRRKSGDLIEAANGVSAYWFFQLLLIIPCKRQIREASQCLLYISNSLFQQDRIAAILESRSKIMRLLNIDEVWDL